MAEEKFIDIEKLIASKNPKALKRTPKFIIRYLKKILHQKEINDFLVLHKDKKNAEFCSEVVKYFNIKIELKNLENIPKSGKVVFAMNHPLGGMDALILIDALKETRTDLKFIVNDLLMNLENLSDLFVGVNKHGKNKGSVRQQIEELFESDQAVCIFPAGLVSRRKKGVVEDLIWKKTFVTYARSHGHPIVPIYIDGSLSNFFYRLSNLRSFIGVKTNIEMLYLSNELFKQRDKTLKFIVGKPVSDDLIRSEASDQDVAQEVKKLVYELRKEL